MNNQLIKFEPILVIQCKDGKLYFSDASNKTAIQRVIKAERFIELEQEAINTSLIERVYIDKAGVAGLSRDQRIRLEKMKTRFQQENHCAPTQEDIQKMVHVMLCPPKIEFRDGKAIIYQ